MEEVWKDIQGYEGKYQVSTLGNVCSLNYNNTGKRRNLKIKVNRYGFSEVSLSKNNKVKSYMLARLVAETFIPNRNKKPVVTHINNDKQDCSVKNIKWAYVSETRFLMYKKGNRKIGKATKNIISYKGISFKSYREIARHFGIKEREFYKRLDRRMDFRRNN